ncbi:MAG: MBL fold metallo-hydrolase [Anaerolineae bacterium]|nr:MBL fold metallo-hydrolase [Anaerolineae bacterium]
MPVEIVALTLGMVQTNCYIIGDTDSGSAVVIDPADNAPMILRSAAEREWTIRLILATHEHFDHVLAADELHRDTSAPFYIHQAGVRGLQAMQATAALFGLSVPPPPEPAGFVAPGQSITLDGIVLDVLYTPGHAPGHVSFVLASEQIVFSGDCLFHGSIGRTDLPGANYDDLMRSIREELLPLGDAFTVAPGHGPLTTIRDERATNPFLQE